jgi:pre-mRNA-splicing factor ATP-dependent RNA helicase DHX15/PRP43
MSTSKKEKLPIGIFDVKGENINPFTKNPYENLYSSQQMDVNGEKVPMTYANLATKWSQLTVYKYKDELLDSIKNNQVTLAKAGTGVGKTVLIPKIALHAFDYEGKVLTTIPKRLITRSNAEYAAKCLDSKLGDHVGYYFKGDNKISKNSKLIFTTTGSILSKVTGNDPYLEDYNCIVIDEAHERSVQTDLLLLLIKNALKKRKDLRLVIMSATINLEAFRNYYKEFTFGEVDIPGLTFSVKQFWLPQRPDNWYKSAVERVMKILTTTDDGDILIFGKASSDGVQVCSMLDKEIADYNKNIKNPDEMLIPFCVKLAGNSTQEEEDLAKDEKAYLEIKSNLYKGNYNRKVVVSTNVAESSLTIDGIVYVIDSGYEFRESYNPETMVRSLLEEYAPQSSIIQRKGRAGRTREGYCYHLYSEKEYDELEKYPIPDIQKTDLSSYLLDLMRLKYIHNIGELKNLLKEFISPPAISFVESSLKLLESLGAITTKEKYGELTEKGRAISQFRGIKLGLANAILYSSYAKCFMSVIDIVSLLIVADGQLSNILLDFKVNKKLPEQKQKQLKKEYEQAINKFTMSSGDIFTLLKIFREFKAKTSELKLEALLSKKVEKDIIEDDNLGDLAEDLGLEIDKSIADLNVKELVGGSNTHKKLLDWCKQNHLHCKNLERSQFLAKEISRIMNDLMKESKTPLINFQELNKTISIGNINKEDEKILMAFVLGNFHNLGAKTSKPGTYESCFPMKHSNMKISPESKISNPEKIIMFDELFMGNKSNPTVKANMVTSIPPKILELPIIKEKLTKYCELCLKKRISIKSSKRTFKFNRTIKRTKGKQMKKTKKTMKKQKDKSRKFKPRIGFFF